MLQNVSSSIDHGMHLTLV